MVVMDDLQAVALILGYAFVAEQEHAGRALTRYRNRVRVARAMDRLEAGQPHLGQLAADLGFADQAHLTRTVKEHLGHTATVVRELLRGHRRTSAPGR